MPLIDILLPVFNGAEYLRASLESLQKQTFADFRVLILDDGSTDDSRRIAWEFSSEDARFELHELPRRGLVSTLNHGISLVDAPYLARQDADDLSMPRRLDLQFRYLETHRDVAAVSGHCLHMDELGIPLRVNRWPPDPGRADPFAIPADEPYLAHPFLMARTDAIRRVGGYRHILHSEDSDLYWRLFIEYRLKNIFEPVGLYRMHRGSVSAQSIHNVEVQSFSSQLAALSFRRVVAGLPDFGINEQLACAIEAAPTIAEMVAQVEGLTEAERVYLLYSSRVKASILMSVREIPADFSFISESIDAYSSTKSFIDDNGRILRRHIRANLKNYMRLSISGSLRLFVLYLRARLF